MSEVPVLVSEVRHLAVPAYHADLELLVEVRPVGQAPVQGQGLQGYHRVLKREDHRVNIRQACFFLGNM